MDAYRVRRRHGRRHRRGQRHRCGAGRPARRPRQQPRAGRPRQGAPGRRRRRRAARRTRSSPSTPTWSTSPTTRPPTAAAESLAAAHPGTTLLVNNAGRRPRRPVRPGDPRGVRLGHGGQLPLRRPADARVPAGAEGAPGVAPGQRLQRLRHLRARRAGRLLGEQVRRPRVQRGRPARAGGGRGRASPSCTPAGSRPGSPRAPAPGPGCSVEEYEQGRKQFAKLLTDAAGEGRRADRRRRSRSAVRGCSSAGARRCPTSWSG